MTAGGNNLTLTRGNLPESWTKSLPSPTERAHQHGVSAQCLTAGDCFRLTCTLCLKLQHTSSQRSRLNGHPFPHSVMLWPRGSFQDVRGAKQAQTTCSHAIPLGTVPHQYVLACLTLRQSLFWFSSPHSV